MELGYLLIGDMENSRPENVVPAETSISLLTPAQLLSRFSSTNIPTAIVVFRVFGSVSSWRITFRNLSLHIISKTTLSLGGSPSISMTRFTSANLKGRKDSGAATHGLTWTRKSKIPTIKYLHITEGYEFFRRLYRKLRFAVRLFDQKGYLNMTRPNKKNCKLPDPIAIYYKCQYFNEIVSLDRN